MSISSPFRLDCLEGKVACVTGGASGICFEITRALLLSGCKGAVICGRRETFLKKAADILRQETGKQIEYHVCDVRNYEMCEKVIQFIRQTFGRLDILINGAAGNFLAPASQLSHKGFATVMAIDALGTFNMSRAAHSLLVETVEEQKSHNKTTTATIINISATLQYGATWWQAHASAAKSAVDSLTRSLALEWGQDGIRVNGIAPGPIDNTPGMTKLAPTSSNENSQKDIRENVPLQRLGETWEIGQAAVYLCLAEYVTGHVLVVDGGHYLHKHPWIPKEAVMELSRNVEAKSRAQGPRSSL